MTTSPSPSDRPDPPPPAHPRDALVPPRNRHQDRFRVLVRAVQDEHGVSEAPLPEATYRVDLLLDPGPVSDAWGLLREDLADRAAVLEHFSRAPAPIDLATALMKTTWGLVQWFRARRSRGEKKRQPTLGLVLCVGKPASALDFFELFRATEVPGLYRTKDRGLELIVVDVAALPRRPGCSFLRLLDHRSPVAEQNLRDLQDDPTISTLTKRRIRKAIMSNPASFTPRERALTYEAVLAKGRKEGRTEAALALATCALEARLGRPLPVTLKRALQACSDPAVLRSLVELTVRADALDAPELKAKAAELLRRGTRPPRARSSRIRGRS